jgi:hypothetical protein
MIIPGEIQTVFDEARCPICQEHLQDLNTYPFNIKYPYDEIEHEDEIGYLSEMSCPDPDHYYLSIEWSKLSKGPLKRDDSLVFCTLENEYSLVIAKDYYPPLEISTYIRIRPLDENGSISDEKTSHSLEFQGTCFDLSNFDQERYIDQIETLMMLK